MIQVHGCSLGDLITIFSACIPVYEAINLHISCVWSALFCCCLSGKGFVQTQVSIGGRYDQCRFGAERLPGVISESETQSYTKGHISYELRDPTKTYRDGTQVMTAAISSALTEGERFLSIFSQSAPEEPETLSFAWEDWKRQFVFATLLYGGFEDEEEVYRAFSDKEIPEGEKSFEWDAQLPGGYCRVTYILQDSDFEASSFGRRILKQYYIVYVKIFESESLYQKMQQEMMDKSKAFARAREKASH